MTSTVYSSSSNNKVPSNVANSVSNAFGEILLINGVLFVGTCYVIYSVFLKR